MDLGQLPGSDNAWAKDVNEAGDVTGFARSTDLTVQHGFLRTAAGAFTDLGELPGFPYVAPEALNEQRVIVGEARIGESAPVAARTAFVWIDGQIVDLNQRIPPGSPWQLLRAEDVNEAGQIVVWARSTVDAGLYAVRLDPEGFEPDPAPDTFPDPNPMIPDPVPLTSPLHLALLALLLAGAGAWFFRRV
jgi:probable HAF family extracellular repeat protein